MWCSTRFRSSGTAARRNTPPRAFWPTAPKRVIGLSGTPIYNRGAEIWNVINILDFHFLGNYESFTREWCYGYGNQIVQKPELLGDYLRARGHDASPHQAGRAV